jgi:hypothetical protein
MKKLRPSPIVPHPTTLSVGIPASTKSRCEAISASAGVVAPLGIAAYRLMCSRTARPLKVASSVQLSRSANFRHATICGWLNTASASSPTRRISG